MPKVKLTDAAVQRYKAAPGARTEYFDAALPGFALRVSGPTPGRPEGSKSWVLFYRFEGKQKRLTLMPGYPELGLAEARRKAREALQQVGEHKDPAAEKQAAARPPARPADTVENVVDLFMRRHMEGQKRAPRYIEETRRNFDLHVLPRWRGRELKSITRRDVIELLDAIVDEGKPVAANRVKAALSVMINWSIGRDIIAASPIASIARPGAETSRERVLADDEIRLIWQSAGALGNPFGSFFRLALLTGQRRSEVAGMRWADIDEAEALWTLPAALTKAKRTHAVPLSPAAMTLIGACPRSGAFVLTTRGDRPISGFSKAKADLDGLIETEAGEAPEPWHLHDLRRTAATGMARLGIDRLVIGRVLNHADSSVTGIYDRHAYLEQKRRALDAWGQYLENLTSPTPGANIVPLRHKA